MRMIWILFLLILKKDNIKSYVYEFTIRLIHKLSLKSLKDLQSSYKICLISIFETISQLQKSRIKHNSKTFKKHFHFLKLHPLRTFPKVKICFKNNMRESFENIRLLQKDTQSLETLLTSLNWTLHFIFKNTWKAFMMHLIRNLMSLT